MAEPPETSGDQHSGPQAAPGPAKDFGTGRGVTEKARRALLDRPIFSLKLHLLLGSILTFIFGVAVAIAMFSTSRTVDQKLVLLDVANEFVMELQQARRFEKNYFLYKTNLPEAIDFAYRAEDILQKNSEPLRLVMGPAAFSVMAPHLERYQELLSRLAELEKKPQDASYHQERDAVELELREHGQKMVSLAERLVQKEKESVGEAMRRFRLILAFSVCFLTAFMVIITWLLKERIMGSLRRFGKYAERIARGDYTPITPVRRFRDEFSYLAIAINHMIDEIQKREDFLIQSHKMRAVGTLTAGVAHELNNPLNNVMLTAHMLLEDYATLDDQERKEMVEDVVNEAGRAQKIIRNLLDFARESGTHLEPLDLREMIMETTKLAANQVKLSGVKIETSAVDNLPRVHGDRQQLQQVFLNLILNALDASPKGSKIQVMVMAADEPNYLAVKVIDQGSGVPQHLLASIFDPFFTTKPSGKGTGLGLSVSQGIVAKHGGKISVNSHEGVGSTFTVTLPITTIPANI